MMFKRGVYRLALTAVVLNLIAACALKPTATSTPEPEASPTLTPYPTPKYTLYPTPTQTVTPTATQIPVPTATPIPPTPTSIPDATAVTINERTHYLLYQDTHVYRGPGNAAFDIVATLGADQAVYPLGAFVDFLYVEATVGGDVVTGFIHKHAVGRMSTQVQVDPGVVPWKPLYLPNCSPGVFDAATNTTAFANDSDGYYDTQSKGIGLDAPLRIKIDRLSVDGASFGSIKILGVPSRQDAWWKGITRLDIAYNDGDYQLGVRDGTTESLGAVLDLPVDADQPIQIVFEQVEGKSFVILDEKGEQIARVDLTQLPQVDLPGGLFPEGNVYVGTSTSPHSTLVVTGLRVGVLPDGKWDDRAVVGPGLAELAGRHNITIGTEFSVNNMMDLRYCRAMKRDFNVAAVSEFTWSGIWLGPGEYDLKTIDRAVDYATGNGWRIRAMHLVWGALEVHAIPDWILNGNFTRDEYIDILEQHVKTMVGNYKGRVHEWSIANEYPSRLASSSDFWNEVIGPEYVEMAFRWAKETDPDGILIFNDYNNESSRDLETSRNIQIMYDKVKALKEKGVPIDAVGLQMHLLLKWSSPTPPAKADVIATMQRFADLGVRVYITELDVDLSRQKGTRAERWQFQAQIYRDMLEACLESGVCDSFTTWGISDSTSWITCEDPWCQLREPDADPLMFDKDFNPKPAYLAVRDVLSE
jgi:endo-1,4-beta-xylanase